ncbi:hypothetical protein ACFXK0_06070 [Nocardia sp. NPDC059177]|uniref:hypothetical protein n=1 Tax=Nocardia sp. NPDC059177 TaxID=3346759 RepID=UPI0036AFBDE9
MFAVLESRFDDALVVNWEPHEGTFGLPDPDDEHVVAAAVVGGADTIVTQNLRDFPADHLPDGLSVRSAAQFAADTVAVSPETAVFALRTMLSRYRNPVVAEEDALKILVSRYRVWASAPPFRAGVKAHAGGSRGRACPRPDYPVGLFG